MPEYELSEGKKAVLIQGLDLLIQQTQQQPDKFAKGMLLAVMFETKEILQHNRLTWKH